jgi:hypothetical protein
LTLFVAVDGEAGRIISAIFFTSETIAKDL